MINGRSTLLRFVIAAVLGLGILALLTWGNYAYSVKNPGGNDFLTQWVSTRTFLTAGISPYSDETSLQIQLDAYGRPALPGEYELRETLPLYSIAVFLPFALIKDYFWARAAWMTVLEIGIVLLSIVSIKLVDWRPGPIILGIFIFFSLLWYHAFRPIINGNVVILVALFLAGGLLALKNGQDELAGVLIALSTIKPQVVILAFIFLLIWSIQVRRWRLTGWMLSSLVLLIAIAALLLPDWLLQNLREFLRYPANNPPSTLQSALGYFFPAMGARIGWIIAGVLGVVLLIEWWLARRWDFGGILWTTCFSLVVSQWIGIQTDPANFIITLPATVLVFSLWEERWRRTGRIFTYACLLLLFFGIWALVVSTTTNITQPIQNPMLFFPYPVFMLVMLFWVRWWAVKPLHPWFDSIYMQENPWRK